MEDLVQALHLLGTGVDQGLSVPRDLPQLSHLDRKDELGRTIPWAATSASHSASEMSVFLPGTFFTELRCKPQLGEEPI